MASPAAFAPGPGGLDEPRTKRICCRCSAAPKNVSPRSARMKAERSVAVERIAPDAHAPLGLRKVVTSCGLAPGLTTYPWRNGAGSVILLVGNVVCVRPAASKTTSWSSVRNDLPVTASAMRPTTMLSVFEYSYREPGLKTSPSPRTQVMIPMGETYPRGLLVACLAKPRDLV